MKERPILFSAPMVRAIFDGKKTQTRRIVKPQPIEPAPRPLRHAAKHPVPYFDSYCGERKTQANPRGMSDRWCWWSADDRPDPLSEIRFPYGAPGDRLWVREAWAVSCLDPLEYLYGPLAALGLRAYGGGAPFPGCHLRVRDTDAMIEYQAHPTSPTELARSPGYTTWRSRTPERWRSPIFMPRWASRITLELTDVRVQRVQDISEDDARSEGIDGPHYGRWTDARGAMAPPLTEPARPWAHSFAVAWREIYGGDDASWFANPWVWALTFKRVVP